MDDSTLIEQIQLGSKDAFKQMFIKFYSPLCEYASQYVSDEDAEELIQELMLFIWENRNSLFVEISLKSYLFLAVKHRCLNAIRKNQYHERIHNQIYEKIKGLCQSVFEKSFPQSARPTLRYILPEFGCRSPLRRPHPDKISHKL